MLREELVRCEEDPHTPKLSTKSLTIPHLDQLVSGQLLVYLSISFRKYAAPVARNAFPEEGAGILLASLAVRCPLEATGPDAALYDLIVSAGTQQLEYPPEGIRGISQQIFIPDLQIPFAVQSSSIQVCLADPVAPPVGKLAQTLLGEYRSAASQEPLTVLQVCVSFLELLRRQLEDPSLLILRQTPPVLHGRDCNVSSVSD